MKKSFLFVAVAMGLAAVACVDEAYDLSKPIDPEISLFPDLTVAIPEGANSEIKVPFNSLVGSQNMATLSDGTKGYVCKGETFGIPCSQENFSNGWRLGDFTLHFERPQNYSDASYMRFEKLPIEISLTNPTGVPAEFTATAYIFVEGERRDKEISLSLTADANPQTVTVDFSDVAIGIPSYIGFYNVYIRPAGTKSGVKTAIATNSDGYSFGCTAKLIAPLSIRGRESLRFNYSFDNLNLKLSDISPNLAIKKLKISGKVTTNIPAEIYTYGNSEQFTLSVSSIRKNSDNQDFWIEVLSKDGELITEINKFDVSISFYNDSGETVRFTEDFIFQISLDEVTLPAGVTITNDKN